MQVNENASVVKEVNAEMLAGVEENAIATGDLDLFVDVDPPVVILTSNLTGAVNVGINVRAARREQRFRVVRNSAAPGAFAVTVKSGTAAAGTTIATIEASANGHVEAVFNGSVWKRAGDAAAA